MNAFSPVPPGPPHASHARPAPVRDLRRTLAQRTLLVGGVVALLQALLLCGWAVLNTHREIAASREIVRATAARIVHEQSGQGGVDPSAEASMRHVRLVDADAPAGSPGWVDRWFAGHDEIVEVPLARGDGSVDRLRLAVRGSAASELTENLQTAGIALLSLAGFALAMGAFQYRSLSQALAPVSDMVARLARFEAGDRSVRLEPPPLAELARLAEGFNRLAEGLATHIDAQQRLSRDLLSLRADERGRLAREMHDEFGQTLTLMSANLALAERSLADTTRGDPAARAGTLIATLRGDVGALQQRVRTLLAGLRDERFAPESAAPDLRSLLEQWQLRYPSVDWSIEPSLPDWADGLPADRGACVARVVQESLTNAFRHARPRRLLLHRRAGPAVDGRPADVIEVDNDGVPATAGAATPVRRQRFGLVGMRERAAAVGASVTTGPPDGDPGRWQVRLTLPARGGPR